jgi:two-component system cell cycle sensor histidine kinase/response regulator CckA
MTPSTAPRIWPSFWANALRDRLQFFRLLCLLLALLTLGGVVATLVLAGPRSPAEQVRTTTAAAVLAGLWIFGYRKRGLSPFWIVPEAVLLLVLTQGIQNMFASFGVMYTALQFRATCGTRREATSLAFAYAGTLLFGHAFVDGLASIRPIVVVELAAGAFNAYLMHTLSEVLSRDQKRATELKRSEDRYRALFNNNPWPMWEVDPTSFAFLDVNDAAVKQYGYSREEFVAMTIRDLRAPSDLRALEEIVPDLVSDRRFRHVAQLQRKDGSVIDVEITSEMLDFDGRRVRVAIGVDVTERERAERALRESEQRFRSVIENLREALMITDTHDRILLANPRVRDVLGYEPEEVIGKVATDLLLPESQRHLFRDKLSTRLEGQSELYETELLRKDGRRIFAEVSASPYRDASGRIIGTLGAVSDISERKRLEERLHQGLRLEVVGQLAGGVAHDFNNLLTVIKCNTELLLSDLSTEDPTWESLAEIERSADRGATLTQQLLAFSRKQLLQPRRVTLGTMVSETAPMLRRLAGDKIAVTILDDGAQSQVHADPLQLEHALSNLVRNASEAMPGGGRITIATGSVELGDFDPPVATQDIPTGRYAMLSVSDNGPGMAPEVAARLFEPFATTKEAGESTGLGLASMYGIVRQSGGYVDVDSAPGAGTTFRIYLPLTRDEARVERRSA